MSGDVVPGGKALCQRLGFSNVDELCPKSTKQGDSLAPYDAYEKLRAYGVSELRREEVQNVKSDQEEVRSNNPHKCVFIKCATRTLVWVWIWTGNVWWSQFV